MPGHADALRDMATVTSIVGQMPGERPAAWWVEVARIVCERHGIKSLNGHDHDQVINVPKPTITKRQIEILSLMAQGLTYKQIASRLVVSENTVKTALQRAYTQLGATGGPHAVALALRAGLIH